MHSEVKSTILLTSRRRRPGNSVPPLPIAHLELEEPRGLPAGFQGVWVPEGKQGLMGARVSAGPRAPETAFPGFRNSKVLYRYLGTAASVPWFCANFQRVVNQ